MTQKEDAIARLERLIEEAPGTISQPAYAGWRRSARRTITRIFGDQSSQIEDFDREQFVSTQKSILQSLVIEIQEDVNNDDKQPLPVQTPTLSHSSVEDPRIVFVVHGRNLGRRDALFRFLRSIGLTPLEWSQAITATGKVSPYIGEVLDAAFSRAQAVVVLMTPDDKAYLRTALRKPDDPAFEAKPTYQARPNVLFEAGMAMGRAIERTIIVQVGELRPFSDLGGRHVMKLDNSTERRQELAQRLKSAGCPVDLTGTDWHREGDFNILADESLNKP
jgi:predicted nucleotide-binding protein